MSSDFRYPIQPGEPVRCYRNLRPGVPTWSVQARCRVPGTANTHRWYVVGHADDLVLRDATFTVYERGRLRVLATGRKNVHAFVLGVLAKLGHPLADGLGVFDQAVRYAPAQGPHFHHPATPHQPVHYAEGVVLDAHGKVWARAQKPPIGTTRTP